MNKKTWLFLIITFGLTIVLDIILRLISASISAHTQTILLELQMLIPASVAMAILVRETRAGYSRTFFFFFLGYAVVFAVLALTAAFVPRMAGPAASAAMYLTYAGLAVIVVLNLLAREDMTGVGLGFGQPKFYLLGLALVVFYLVGMCMDLLFGLGKMATSQINWPLAGNGLYRITIMPFLGIMLYLGEEYGWRGLLQTELIKSFGRIKGLLVGGIIWGLWHVPIIVMLGYNYPGHPVLGSVLMTVFCVVFGFFLGYSVLVSGSIILSSFLHGVNNLFMPFLASKLYVPNSELYNFTFGVFGLVLGALVLLVLVSRSRLFK